ncbi:MAG TPA: hypothetical protein VG079_07570 [Gaiellaceae bacterium]|nr:hypothetical protein [Gaiellaceae bacterium]
MRRLAFFALIAAAVAVVMRALRRDDFETVEAGGEPVAASVGHASVGPVEKQEAEEPPSGPAETPGTTAPPL